MDLGTLGWTWQRWRRFASALGGAGCYLFWNNTQRIPSNTGESFFRLDHQLVKKSIMRVEHEVPICHKVPRGCHHILQVISCSHSNCVHVRIPTTIPNTTQQTYQDKIIKDFRKKEKIQSFCHVCEYAKGGILFKLSHLYKTAILNISLVWIIVQQDLSTLPSSNIGWRGVPVIRRLVFR